MNKRIKKKKFKQWWISKTENLPLPKIFEETLLKRKAQFVKAPGNPFCLLPKIR